MDHLGGLDRETQHVAGHAGRDLVDLQRKPPRGLAGAREEHLERRIKTLARAGRPHDGQRPLAPAREAAQSSSRNGKRAEMIAVQMAENNAVDSC